MPPLVTLVTMQSTPEPPQDDALDLERADHEIRIEKLKQEIENVAGEPVCSGQDPDCPPEVAEAFWESVLAVETHGAQCPYDELVKSGFSLPPPEELDDPGLSATLWDLIRVLAEKRLFLTSTDHLSDRELYSWLWREALREEFMGFGLPFGNFYLDGLGSCSEEDILLRMRYYADEEERARFAADFPDYLMPPREKPAYDRDRHLPQPEE
jgi:hypothetical protein